MDDQLESTIYTPSATVFDRVRSLMASSRVGEHTQASDARNSFTAEDEQAIEIKRKVEIESLIYPKVKEKLWQLTEEIIHKKDTGTSITMEEELTISLAWQNTLIIDTLTKEQRQKLRVHSTTTHSEQSIAQLRNPLRSNNRDTLSYYFQANQLISEVTESMSGSVDQASETNWLPDGVSYVEIQQVVVQTESPKLSEKAHAILTLQKHALNVLIKNNIINPTELGISQAELYGPIPSTESIAAHLQSKKIDDQSQ